MNIGQPTPRTEARLRIISAQSGRIEFSDCADYEDFCFNELKKFACELENENALNVSMLGDEILLAESLIHERDALLAMLAKASHVLTEFGQITDESRVGWCIKEIDSVLGNHGHPAKKVWGGDLGIELRRFLDSESITSANIGSLRARCFVPWDSAWNALVRDETASREQSPGRAERQPPAENGGKSRK